LIDEKEIIVGKVREWIENPEFQIEDVSNPELRPDEIAIHVKGKTEKDYFGNRFYRCY
jgi:hypothetical protein